MIKSNRFYDALKFIALVVLPAAATLYFALAGIWGLPSAEQVVGTIVAVDTFLGTLLHLSSSAYHKGSVATGSIDVVESNLGKTFSLTLDGDPEYELEGKDKAVFKVNKTVAPQQVSRPKQGL